MMPGADSPALAPPGVFRRLAALFYDFFLLCAIWFAATLAVLALRGGTAIPPSAPWFAAYLLGVAFVFFGWFWTHGGQTLGMKAWKIRVLAANGASLTWNRAALRFLLATGLLGLGLIWIIFDREKRALHDIASGTRLIRQESG